jgi:acyl-CoA thioester hydrolase
VIGLEVPVVVRWSDMDAFGHVNNVQVLRLLEEARVTAFAHLRGDGPTMLETGVVVARHEVEYLRPLVWRPQPVTVRLWVTALGGASFELGYTVGGAAPATADGGASGAADEGASGVTALAASTMVAVDRDTGSPRRLSAGERAVLQGWVGESVPFRRRAASGTA